MASATAMYAQELPGWEQLSRVRPTQTRVVPAFWAHLPPLDPKAKIKVLDVDGPGVVTTIHCSGMGAEIFKFDAPASQSLVIRVYYDGQEKPAIAMPLMDFLGDIECRSAYFRLAYFSKVRESHNFRLPMPFRKHITIEIENPSDRRLMGYADLQWEKVDKIPADSGYLHADYRSGSLSGKARNTVFECDRPATIVAHWLQYASEKSDGGEVICEADQQLYLDGDARPTLNYLGSEDLYGHSWGFKETNSDGYAAILRRENLQPKGALIAALRCRTSDAISFAKSCRWIITWENDGWAAKLLADTPIPFRHCVYYYAAPIEPKRAGEAR
jgi:hypothetical protein